MKLLRYIILLFYIVLVIPVGLIMMGSLIYGGIVETIKIMKNNGNSS